MSASTAALLSLLFTTAFVPVAAAQSAAPDLSDPEVAHVAVTANAIDVELGKLATYQTPLLRDLRAAAPGLNKLAKNLPAFNDGTRVSLKSLGGASEVGSRALTKATDEIATLNDTAQRAFPAADQVARFLESHRRLVD